MLFSTPTISAVSARKLDELDGLRTRLGAQASQEVRWMGPLRRSFKAANVGSSTAIEGFTVSADDALALVDGHEPVDPDDEDRMAVSCYARAMDHVTVMAADPGFCWSDRAIKDLHFDACFFQSDKSPGRWRESAVSVTAGHGATAYRGPDAETVPALMDDVVTWLADGDPEAHVVVRAAMAHLHVVSVHPFEDGNGRAARIVQSLVLARDGLLAPDLASIEQYLGEHTTDYYNALRTVQGGSYRPERDAGAWVRLCIDAHLAQAQRRLTLIEDAGRRWAKLEALVAARGWPDRLTIALEQALFGRTDRPTYAREADVSPATASSDLRRLADAGLLAQHGRTRSAHYRPTAALRGLASGG
jgi:Fic family protein